MSPLLAAFLVRCSGSPRREVTLEVEILRLVRQNDLRCVSVAPDQSRISGRSGRTGENRCSDTAIAPRMMHLHA